MDFTGERFIPEYEETDQIICNEHFNRYQSIAQYMKDLDVLDAACGAGYGSSMLADFAKSVTGIDIDQEAIDYAKERYSGENITFQAASIDTLPFDDASFDTVVSFETIEHVDATMQQAFLHEVRRVMKAGGHLIISTPDKAIYSDAPGYNNEFHVKEFYASEFYNFLKKYFAEVHFFYQRKEICEIINSHESEHLQIIRKADADSIAGKYIIAVCSDSESELWKQIGGTLQIQTGEYNLRINRIMELQAEVEKKNRWAFSLNDEIERLRNALNADRATLAQQKNELMQKNAAQEVLRGELESAKKTLKEKEAAYVEMVSSGEALRHDLDASRALLEMRSGELDEMRQQVSKDNVALEMLNSELGVARESLKEKEFAYRQKVEDFERLLHDANLNRTLAENRGSELENMRSSLHEVENEKDTLLKQLESMKQKSEELRNASSNIEAYQHLRMKYREKLLAEFLEDISRKKRQMLNPFALFKKAAKLKKELAAVDTRFKKVPRKFLDYFNAGAYLEVNEDVVVAIEKGDFENALEHFIFFGYDEVRGGVRQLHRSVAAFNEDKYLCTYDDIQRAVERGDYKSGYDHFISHGFKELLQGSRFVVSERSEKPSLKLIEPESIIIAHHHVINVPQCKKPLVSIVVPAYNQAQYTMACIESIVNHTSTLPYEIILMDDKSPGEDARNLKYFINGITFVSNEENLGFLRNCNKGASLAKGKYVLFLNNDTNVQPGWLDSLVELIESDEMIGMVGSRLIYPDGRQQEAGGIVWNDASGWNFGRLDDPAKAEYNYVKEVDYVSGAAIMISMALWNEIGGFDERFVPAYYEDTDLAFEVRKRGYKVMYQPKSVVVHFEGVSNGTDLGSGIKQYQVINHEKFLNKWRAVLERDQFANAQEVFLARDRSRNKSHVLFVDHYLPHYDQDAGSKATYQYLRILADSGMQVHFIGDNFWHYPDTPYLEALTSMGIEVLYGNGYAQNWPEWIRENGKYFDYVVLSRPHISVKYIDLVKEVSNAKIIYFGHDLHFLREEREYQVKKEEKYLVNSQNWKQQELELMAKSDVAYYFSDLEKEVVEAADSSLNVDVVPLYIYDSFRSVDYDSAQRKDIMFVGGFGHGPNADAMKWFVHEVWPAVRERLGNVHFYIIGSKPSQEILDMGDEDITVTGFISDEELDAYYRKCRLVVAPLRFGAGVKGKIVDAIYNGMPLVTTSIGAEGLPGLERFMRIADDAASFAEAVCSLYQDEAALCESSRESFEYCKTHFSEAAARQKMSKVITEFVES